MRPLDGQRPPSASGPVRCGASVLFTADEVIESRWILLQWHKPMAIACGP
jgi:hypothetical protein